MVEDKHCPKKELRHSSAYLCISQLKMLGSVHANGTLPALSQHRAALRSCGTGSCCMQLCDIACLVV